MITLAVEQGSEAWIQARLGIPTASNFRRIITASGVLSRSSVGYMNELLAEWQSGTRQVIYTSKWMQRGIEMEAEARSSYALRTNTKVAQVGLVYRDKNRLIAASPDGLVNQDGLLEIKCPQPAKHETYLYHGKVPTIYIPQVQGQLRLCKKPSIGRIAGGKPLRVWLFYWVPASAGTTNIEFLHSLSCGLPSASGVIFSVIIPILPTSYWCGLPVTNVISTNFA